MIAAEPSASDMASSTDLYDILGVKRTASADEIRAAYRKLARQLHPDVNKAPDAAQKFARVQEAYDVLSDADKRRAYDQFGHAGVASGAAAGGSGGPFRGQYRASRGGPDVHFGGMDPDEFASIFDQFMGGGFAGRGSSTPRQPARGRDIEHTIRVPFRVAALGGEETLRIRRSDDHAETVEVRIPPGTASGTKMRLRGRGESARPGGKRGDLILTIEVEPHPWFRRDGLDLMLDVPITIAEAALGATVTVPLLEGQVQVTVPPGTSSGKRLRIRGRGLRDNQGRQGDFYVVVQIVAPAGLSPEDRRLLSEIGARLENPRDNAPWADKMG